MRAPTRASTDQNNGREIRAELRVQVSTDFAGNARGESGNGQATYGLSITDELTPQTSPYQFQRTRVLK